MIYYQFKKKRLNCRNTIYKTIYCFLFTRKSSVAVRCTMLSRSIIPVIDLRVDRQKFDLLGFFNVSKPMVFQQKHSKRWTPIICSRNNIIYVSLSLFFLLQRKFRSRLLCYWPSMQCVYPLHRTVSYNQLCTSKA